MNPVAYREAQAAGPESAHIVGIQGRQVQITKAFVLIALLALAIRLTFFIGYQGRDDRNYLAYAHHVASGQTIASLDVQTQWVGRVGFWLPLAASISRTPRNTPSTMARYSFRTTRDSHNLRSDEFASAVLAMITIPLVSRSRRLIM
jgi:hypothetical protein